MAARGDVEFEPTSGKRTEPDSTTNEMSHTKMARMSNSTLVEKSHCQSWLHNPDTNVRYFKTNQAHKTTFKTQKAFYIELTNEDFDITQLWNEWNIERTDFKNMFAVLKTPYYYFPWWYLTWYLHQGEYKWLTKNTSKARIKESSFQVNVVGHRLPFTTNDTSSSVANSLVDQSLDVFKGMNKVWPNYPQFKGYSAVNPNIENTVKYLVPFLYGAPASHTTDFSTPQAYLGATAKYMDYGLLSHLTKMTHYTDVTNGKNYVTAHQDFTTFPDFAKLKYADCDLKLFRGPIAQVTYQPKHGHLKVGNSILDNSVWGYSETAWGICNQMQHLSVPKNQWNYTKDISVMNTVMPNKEGFFEADTSHYYFTDLEVMANIVGSEIPVPKYDDLWLGVRPVYNGRSVQAGVCQLEIRTEIEIEYETFWPAPAVSKFKIDGMTMQEEYLNQNNEDNNGLTNETDLMLRSNIVMVPLDRPKNIPTMMQYQNR